MTLRFGGLGFRDSGVGFKGQGLGFRDSSLGVEDWGSESFPLGTPKALLRGCKGIMGSD